MNNNIIKLKSISELFGESFFVPAYQRGYRWDRSQINDLLNDIYSFANKKNKADKEFYCLQPIIVKHNNNENYYEVIDGQQRLTSIKILLTYFSNRFLIGRSFEKRYGRPIFEIKYETRPELCDIFSSTIENFSIANIDYYHITKAYQYIDEWFKMKVSKDELMEDDLFDSINRTLVYNSTNQKEEGIVQVIWYELKDEKINPIDTFIRINLGKIPLNSAELVKALFLQSNLFGNDDLAKIKQREIAHQWDSIERQLQKEELWAFISNKDFDARIELLLEVLYMKAIDADSKLRELLEKEKNPVFRFYNLQVEAKKDFNTISTLWEDIYKLYNTLLDWYNNPTWYHYIGYLIYAGNSLYDIYKLSMKSEIQQKDDFTKELVRHIGLEFKSMQYLNFEGSIAEFEKKYKNTGLVKPIKLDYKDSIVFNFLLLFNVETIVQQCNKNNLIYKFPFFQFRNMKDVNSSDTTWDIEHVSSYHDNSLKNPKDQIEWMKNALEDVLGLEKEDCYEDIKRFIETDGKNISFEDLKERIESKAGDNNIPDEFKNDIGNLTLLDANTNRGYGNALFVTKRKKIIKKEKSGLFVPIITRNVFLKYYDENKINKSVWSIDDIISYRIEMQKTLNSFLPKL